MVTKMTTKKGSKLGNGHFGEKFEIFGREINTEHKQIPKRYFNKMMRIITAHNILKGFLVIACADI